MFNNAYVKIPEELVSYISSVAVQFVDNKFNEKKMMKRCDEKCMISFSGSSVKFNNLRTFRKRFFILVNFQAEIPNNVIINKA